MLASKSQPLLRFSTIRSITGNIIEVELPGLLSGDLHMRIANGDLAFIESPNHAVVMTRIIRLLNERVTLQAVSGTQGISTHDEVIFPGYPLQIPCHSGLLGRVLSPTGKPLDHHPELTPQDHRPLDGPVVNPVRRVAGSKMVRTDIPMIDLFNTLVESQKIPIFSTAGEPHNALLARIGIQADADIVILGGISLLYDDFYQFQKTFADAGVWDRTTMFIHLASDPIVEALLIPDMCLAVAEHFAVEANKRVLVLLTDMTAFADALKEVAIAMEQIPSNRGYTGDLYSQLARRYEKACDFKGAGSVTILGVTTMPGNDVTHPVPDNTGYITEGQYYLHDGYLDPFGSLSRLKQNVIGKITREDHGQVMNAMIRLYSEATEAEQKLAMSFELSEYDLRLLQFAKLFRSRFMDIHVRMKLEDALELAWRTLAECFKPEELLIKQAFIDEYYPDLEADEMQG